MTSWSLALMMTSLAGGVVAAWGFLGKASPTPDQLRRHFEGKVVWITGASSGIGEALALSLASHGAKLVLSARRREKLDQVAASCAAAAGGECVAKILPFDLSDPTNELLSKGALAAACWGQPVDVLVNNGGIGSRSAAIDTSLEVDERVMAIDFFAAVALTKSVLPSMIDRKQGQIISISSVQGRFGIPFRTSYAAAKHALQGYFDALRAEVADSNIGVLLVCPGYVRTNLSVNAVTGSGGQYSKMDETTAKGVAPGVLAEKIVRAAAAGEQEITVADLKTKAAIAARVLAPGLLHKFLVGRARKQRALENKAV